MARLAALRKKNHPSSPPSPLKGEGARSCSPSLPFKAEFILNFKGEGARSWLLPRWGEGVFSGMIKATGSFLKKGFIAEGNVCVSPTVADRGEIHQFR